MTTLFQTRLDSVLPILRLNPKWVAAVSCSPDAYRLPAMGSGSGTTGKPHRAWVGAWVGAWVYGWGDV